MVVAVDDSEYAPIVLQHAFDLAGRRPPVELHVLAVRADDRADLDGTKARLAAQVGEEPSTPSATSPAAGGSASTSAPGARPRRSPTSPASSAPI